jgi:hypothetical protein
MLPAPTGTGLGVTAGISVARTRLDRPKNLSGYNSEEKDPTATGNRNFKWEFLSCCLQHLLQFILTSKQVP